MIEVERLRKLYGELVAVEDVSFRAEPGEIFGLLGPNGAGKSTAIGCISGLLDPSGGRVTLMGHDVVLDGPASRRRLGIAPQELALYEDLNAVDNLRYWGAAYGMKGRDLEHRVREVLELIGLLDRSKEAVKGFSGGMKRRLNFACGIVHRPAVLLLDEPTVGVDPQSRVRLVELVEAQAKAGVCVLYTTHYMEEAERICDRLAVIDHGRIIASGTLSELRGQVGEKDLVRLAGAFEEGEVGKALAGLSGVEVVHVDAGEVRLALEGGSKRLPELFAALGPSGAEIRETTLTQPSLESLFIKLTGKQLRE